MKNTNKPLKIIVFADLVLTLAERMGFEPMKGFPLYTLSKRAPSTTRPPLQSSKINYLFKYLLSLDKFIVESNGIPIFDFFDKYIFFTFLLSFFAKL